MNNRVSLSYLKATNRAAKWLLVAWVGVHSILWTIGLLVYFLTDLVLYRFFAAKLYPFEIFTEPLAPAPVNLSMKLAQIFVICISGLPVGFILGIGQWPIIQRMYQINVPNNKFKWIGFSSFGWMMGFAISSFFLPSYEAFSDKQSLLIALFTGGLIIGFCQGHLLYSSRSFRIGWVFCNGIGWYVGGVVGFALMSFIETRELPGLLLLGSIIGFAGALITSLCFMKQLSDRNTSA